MPRRITDENVLMERAQAMLPRGVPKEAIEAVECDPYDGANDGPSYWVYLAPGWICPLMECHTIHEDTLAELRPYIKSVGPWPDDPELQRQPISYLKI